MPPAKKFHHNQLPAMPFSATISVTANGVSAAKVVATMLMPAIYHGKLRLPKKNALKPLAACFRNAKAMSRLTNKKKAIINESMACNSMFAKIGQFNFR